MIDSALAAPLEEAKVANAERRAAAAEMDAVAGAGKGPKRARLGHKGTTPPLSPAPAAALPTSSMSVRLASGDSVEASPCESWGVVGAYVSIPESAWDSSDSHTKTERYEVVGFAARLSTPAYVVRVVRGPLLGSSYLASPAVVKSVLPRGLRSKLAASLRKPPYASPS